MRSSVICAARPEMLNAASARPLMDGTDSYNVDDASAKIRIPYAVYTG